MFCLQIEIVEKFPYVTPKQGELNDNPPVVNVLLPDDKSGDEQQQNYVNVKRILESGSSSIFKVASRKDPDKTYCPALENIKPPTLRKSNSQPVLRSSSATVEGLFSDDGDNDDELCSRMSEVRVKSKHPAKSPNPKNNKISDTAIGNFSDLEESVKTTKKYSSSSDISKIILKMFKKDVPEKEKLMSLVLFPTKSMVFSKSLSALSLFEEESAAQLIADKEQRDSISECEMIKISALDDSDKPPLLATSLKCRKVLR